MAGSVSKTPIAVVGAVLVVVVGGYFVYDSTRNPCESIFEQASTRLNATLSVLRSSGEVAIGKTQVQELTERSQLVALNLKTCCIVFDGGKLNSDEFLNCKGSAARYQDRIERIGGIVSAAMAANVAGQTQVLEARAREVSTEVEEAKQSANAFVKQVAQVSAGRAAALPTPANPPPPAADPPQPAATPEPVPPATAAVVVAGGGEVEPNNSAFKANRISAGTVTTGEVTDKKDTDWYRLQPGSTVRDWMLVKLENRSQNLFATLTVYDINKKKIDHKQAANAGANAEVSLVVAPEAEYYLRVGSILSTTGAYALTPTLKKSYDRFEPNDDAFTAKTIAVGSVVDANIMDGEDYDWYRLQTFEGTAMKVRLENGSSSLGPWVEVYDRNKKLLVAKGADNAGQSLDLALKVKSGEDHFVLVTKRWKSAGAYRLSVMAGK